MTTPSISNEQQREFWNGAMGDTWVRERAFIDAMLKPFQDLLVSHASSAGHASILDIGCGNGTTTIAIAEALGTKGHIVGVDISEPMIANARSRVQDGETNIDFIAADASSANLGAERFDLFVSRFGAMFFADPASAFAHLRRSASPGAETAFIVWRSLDENEFMAAGPRAASAFPPAPPKPEEGAPWAFALADPARVHTVFGKAGWQKPNLKAVDLQCKFPLMDLDMFIENLAPIRPDLQELEVVVRKDVMAAVRAALERFVEGGVVKFTARTWLISAKAS